MWRLSIFCPSGGQSPLQSRDPIGDIGSQPLHKPCRIPRAGEKLHPTGLMGIEQHDDFLRVHLLVAVHHVTLFSLHTVIETVNAPYASPRPNKCPSHGRRRRKVTGESPIGRIIFPGWVGAQLVPIDSSCPVLKTPQIRALNRTDYIRRPDQQTF